MKLPLLIGGLGAGVTFVAIIWAPFRKGIGDILMRHLSAWLFPLTAITIALRPQSWWTDPNLFSTWGGVVSVGGICITAAAQGRIDQHPPPSPKMSDDQFFKVGLAVSACGALTWAMGTLWIEAAKIVCVWLNIFQ